MEAAFCLATAARARWLSGVIVRSASATISRPCPPGPRRTERIRSSALTGTPVRGSTQNVLLAWNVRSATTLRDGPGRPSSDVGTPGICWTTVTGMRWDFHGHPDTVTNIVIDAANARMTSASSREVRVWDITPPPLGYLTVLPALILSGLMLGALGMLISSRIKQLENFAGVMNFVIFPMFFASSALYPLWRVQEGSPMLYYVCQINPFTHAVELIRFALYGQINWISLAVVAGCTAVFMIGAIYAYDPSRGLVRRGPAGGET